ncbi:hypothetical protein ABIB40_002795 [Pedobacter sp. UYP30]|uniref:hypothetical protein n=1 Tax=Pedobacter sp. UYP30 TaxID=1756400 RepID=UPI003393D69B
MEVSAWKVQFKKSLAAEGLHVTELEDCSFCLLAIQDAKVIVNLISTRNHFSPQQLIDLAYREDLKSEKFVQLWEDVWLRKPAVVIDRLRSFCGLSKRIHGRKTTFERISKLLAEAFLTENHLQGYASSRFKYGLVLEGQLVAVITFSSARKMDYDEEYRSIEIIRFAVKRGFSVSGGLSKLLKGHYRQYPTNDIMTYIDRDWGKGLAFEKVGFKQVDIAAPQFFELDGDFQRRRITEIGAIFNSGSIKMILSFEDGGV